MPRVLASALRLKQLHKTIHAARAIQARPDFEWRSLQWTAGWWTRCQITGTIWRAGRGWGGRDRHPGGALYQRFERPPVWWPS